jgi:hypothetical protein
MLRLHLGVPYWKPFKEKMRVIKKYFLIFKKIIIKGIAEKNIR